MPPLARARAEHEPLSLGDALDLDRNGVDGILDAIDSVAGRIAERCRAALDLASPGVLSHEVDRDVAEGDHDSARGDDNESSQVAKVRVHETPLLDAPPEGALWVRTGAQVERRARADGEVARGVTGRERLGARVEEESAGVNGIDGDDR